MNKPNQFLFLIMVISIFVLFLPSCQYDFVEIDKPDLQDTVKFSEEIVPIFITNKCTSCHQSNYTEVDFTEQKAFQTIVPALIDTIQPELSKIYTYPAPASSQHQFKKYTPAEAALVLTWLKQGAINN